MGALRFDVRLNEDHFPNLYCEDRSVWDLRSVNEFEERDLFGDKRVSGAAIRFRPAAEDLLSCDVNVHWFLRLWIKPASEASALLDAKSVVYAEYKFIGKPRKGHWQESDVLRWETRTSLVPPPIPVQYHRGSAQDAVFPLKFVPRRHQ